MITTGLPSSVRRPGAFSAFKFNANLQLALTDLAVAIIAEKTAAGTATVDTPIEVFDEDDADTKGGINSLAALGVKKALEQAKIMGQSPRIFMVPIAEPGGGTKATYTFTVTVTTALAGNLVIRIAGRTITVGVSAGDAQNTIATAIKNAIDAQTRYLPGTASVATNVVTFTFATKGVNGNDCAVETVSAPSGVTCVAAASVAGAGAAVITTAVQSLYDRRYNAVCSSNHTTTDIATILVERLASWGYGQQNYRHFFIGERGSLGTAQTLANAAADFGILIGSYEATPSLPLEIAVCDAFAEFGSERPNVNMDGQRVALYPPSATYAYTTAEIESALAGGITPHVPDGSYSKIVRMVTTQTTLDGVPSEALRDIAYSRTAAYRAELHANNFRAMFKQEVITDEVKARIRTMQIGIDRGLEAQNILRDVETFLDQYVVEVSGAVAGRIVSSSPFRVAGPLHQLDSLHTMYL